MTNWRKKARRLDGDEKQLEAAEAYEKAIRYGEADAEDYVNLFVLYFEFLDPGNPLNINWSSEKLDEVWGRALEVLDQSERRFGATTETAFWRKYFLFIHRGDNAFERLAKNLLKNGDSIIPVLHLRNSDTRELRYQSEAQALLDSIRNDNRAQSRYIRSVLTNKRGKLPSP